MSGSDILRALALPMIALAAVAAVLGAQAAHGAGDFTTVRPPDPCAIRTAKSVSTGIEGLGDRLVKLGVANAACQLRESREELILDIAGRRTATDKQVKALHDGLLRAVTELQRGGALPPASVLTREALPQADLPGIVKSGIQALPDSLIDGAFPPADVADVLSRTIENLDLRSLLANLDDPNALNTAIGAAASSAVKDALIAKLRALACDHLPDVISGLVCG